MVDLRQHLIHFYPCTTEKMKAAFYNQGLYILTIKLTENTIIKAGSLPEAKLMRGIYLYIGRAKRHLLPRVRRHLHQDKKLFWHIDYLLQHANINRIWVNPGSLAECQTVSQLRKMCELTQTPIKGFGASDCCCESHLLHMPYATRHICAIINKLQFKEVARWIFH